MGKKKGKRKLTAAERAAKKQRQREYKIIFINGKQKRVKRELDPEIAFPIDDPIWLLQNGMYEELSEWELARDAAGESLTEEGSSRDPDDLHDIPF